MVVAELEGNPVCNDRTLSKGDIGKRPGMHKYRLPFNGLDKIGLHRFHKPCGHGSGNAQVACGYRLAVTVVRKDHTPHTFTQVGKVAGYGQNAHDFRSHGDIKMRTHHEAVIAASVALNANNDVTQRLNAKIHNPARVDARGVDIQTGHS